MNRALVAEDHDDTKAFATQMLAASTDETKIAGLLAHSPVR